MFPAPHPFPCQVCWPRWLPSSAETRNSPAQILMGNSRSPSGSSPKSWGLDSLGWWPGRPICMPLPVTHYCKVTAGSPPSIAAISCSASHQPWQYCDRHRGHPVPQPASSLPQVAWDKASPCLLWNSSERGLQTEPAARPGPDSFTSLNLTSSKWAPSTPTWGLLQQ